MLAPVMLTWMIRPTPASRAAWKRVSVLRVALSKVTVLYSKRTQYVS